MVGVSLNCSAAISAFFANAKLEKILRLKKCRSNMQQRATMSFPIQRCNNSRDSIIMIPLKFPFTEEKIRALKVGDEVLISGVVFTGRDAVHKYLHEGGALPPEVKLRDGILYHCGPVMMKQDDGSWKCTAAGPTTSIREEPYQWQVIRDHGVRGVIGKGGMGDRTLAACKEHGCVYLHAVGGAAQVLADCVKKVRNVYMMKRIWRAGSDLGVGDRRFSRSSVTIDACAGITSVAQGNLCEEPGGVGGAALIQSPL